jgi:hypothetical protein
MARSCTSVSGDSRTRSTSLYTRAETGGLYFCPPILDGTLRVVPPVRVDEAHGLREPEAP